MANRRRRTPYELWQISQRAYPRVLCGVAGCRQYRKGHQPFCAVCWDRAPKELINAIFEAQTMPMLAARIEAAVAWLNSPANQARQEQ